MRIYVYAAIALLFIAALGGIYVAGYKAGGHAKQAQWDQASREAEEAERRARLAREGERRAIEARAADAERRARDADAKWRRARAAVAAPIATAACPPPDRPVAEGSPAPAPQPSAPQPVADSGVRFTPAGLGLWDGAWTGEEGKPVFGDPGDIAAGASSTGATLPTLEEGLENHAENAQRCSENTRQLIGLIALVRKLQAVVMP